jgi:hypothetical protein
VNSFGWPTYCLPWNDGQSTAERWWMHHPRMYDEAWTPLRSQASSAAAAVAYLCLDVYICSTPCLLCCNHGPRTRIMVVHSLSVHCVTIFEPRLSSVQLRSSLLRGV